jgi:archaellum component FlaF (FlaF/FlaG flagellin family)
VETYKVLPYSGGGSRSGGGVPATNYEQRESAREQSEYEDARSDSNPLPLILAAYPSESANSLILATTPADGDTTKLTSTLDVTLPGTDILVEFSSDINWVLPSAVYNQTASSGGSDALTSGAGESHNHTISGGTAASSANVFSVAGAAHKHLWADFIQTEFIDGANSKRYNEGGSGHAVYLSADSASADLYTDIENANYDGDVSNKNHTHTISGSTNTAENTHRHTVTINAHSHTVPATSSALTIKAELVVDGVVITAGLSQFKIEGFTGKEGVIQLRSVYILRKTTGNLSALSAGQHDVGLKFTVTTVDFDTAVSTVTAKNIALILRDAGFDDRVQIFVP